MARWRRKTYAARRRKARAKLYRNSALTGARSHLVTQTQRMTAVHLNGTPGINHRFLASNIENWTELKRNWMRFKIIKVRYTFRFDPAYKNDVGPIYGQLPYLAVWPDTTTGYASDQATVNNIRKVRYRYFREDGGDPRTLTITVIPVINWAVSATGEADDVSKEYSTKTWLNTDSDDSIYHETIASFSSGLTTGISYDSAIHVYRKVWILFSRQRYA